MHRSFVPSLLFILLSILSIAQPAFEKPGFLTDPALQFSRFTTADFDEDGDLDFIVTGSTFDESPSFYFIENLQDGNFAPARQIPGLNTGSEFVFAADIDGDGRMDIIWASGRTLKWQRNSGGAQFQSPIHVATFPNNVTAMAVAYLDGNSTVDVVVGIGESDALAWMANAGGGSFSGAVVLSTTSEDIVDIHIADVDGDGLDDIITASLNAGDVSWHRNLGGGNIGDQQVLTNDLSATYSVTTTDVDNDGDLDILAQSYGGVLCWFENMGNGNFSLLKNISTTGLGGAYVIAGDFNEDGFADVAASGPHPSEVRIFYNNGDKTFTYQGIIDATVFGCRQMAFVDLDMDGSDVLITLSRNDSRLSTYATSNSGLGPQMPVVNTAPGANAVFSGDVNGDGIIDIVATSGADQVVSLFQGLGQGEFASRVVLHTSAQPVSGVKLADVNGDGLPEIFFLSIVGNYLGYLPNLGDNAFGSFVEIDNDLNSPQILQLADVNGDNYIDLGVTSLGNTSVYWYAGNGLGGFSIRETITDECYGCRDFVFEDMDGDGLIDVVAGGASETKVLKNLGFGTFAPIQNVITDVQGGVSVAVFDFNGDGLPDIFAGGNYANRVKYAVNLGNMMFETPVFMPRITFSPQGMVGSDIDQDGDIDLLVTGTLEYAIYVIENLDGEWGPRRIITQSFENPTNLHSADLDGDGYPDFAAGLMNHVVWFPNKLGPCRDEYPPLGLNAQVNPNNVIVTWNAISKTIGCQVNGRKVGTTQNLTQDIPGLEMNSLTVPQSALQGSGQYEWRVRCACSLNPLSVTPWSDWSTFEIPSGNVAASNHLILYPNPVKDLATINFSQGIMENLKVEVYDLQGRIVLSEMMSPQSVNLSMLARGTYIIRTYSETGIHSTRFLKE